MNVSSSFDIETSSFYCLGEKRACLCAWGFGLNGRVIFGRTWEELLDLLHFLKTRYSLNPSSLILPVYIHNESYEFQFMRRRFAWERVFSVKDRYPIRALCDIGIEFRDSLILSGMSLESTAKNLRLYPVEKLVGEWDYKKLRGDKTPITPEEWDYLRNDNLVVMSYIQELLEEFGSINKIPMTKTAFVRDDVRNACLWDGRKSHKRDKDHRYRNYRELMEDMVLTPDEYRLAKNAFQGGFTHSNHYNTGCVINDVASFDICSSYPAVICSEQFPMSKGALVIPKTKEEFEQLRKCYCLLLDLTFYDIDEKFIFDHAISYSKCLEIEGEETDNGRIIRAKRLRICCTNVDLEIYERFYKWKKYSVNKCYRYVKGYLPRQIVGKVISYFEGKTALKGVKGQEANYDRLKTLLNSIYGCMVQDPVSTEIVYDNDTEWGIKEPDMEKELEKYNKSKSRFLSYLWGVWITAYARRNVMSAILSSGVDHIYTDTDSEKLMRVDEHEPFFFAYNALIARKIELCLRSLGIDPKRAKPKTIDGVEKPLGAFEIDAVYKRFMSLGAKRYFVEYEDGSHSLTISGVNKHTASPAIEERMRKKGKDFFDFFKFGAVFEKDFCGKNIHGYIDEPTSGSFVDYMGIRNDFMELSSAHLEETTYKMSASDDYLALLVKDGAITIEYID